MAAAAAPEEDAYLKYFTEHISAIYKVHNPSKVGDVPALLHKHGARLPQLLEAIEKKYGVQHAMTALADAGGGGGAAAAAADDDDDDDDGGDDDDEEEEEEEDDDEDGGAGAAMGALSIAQGAAAAKVAAARCPTIDEITEVEHDDDDCLIPQEHPHCPLSGMPIQFCKYSPYSDAEKAAGGCIGYAASAGEPVDEEDAKLSKRKAKDQAKRKVKSEKTGGNVIMEKVARSRKKCLTVVSGVDGYGLKLKDVAKAIAKKFAASATVSKRASGGEEIQVQGDISATLPPLLRDEFKIPSDKIFFMDGKTKVSWINI